jgi:hypothetical protein
MTIDQIRENAPEGATHYHNFDGGVAYFKIPYIGVNLFWNVFGWSATYRDIGYAKPLF